MQVTNSLATMVARYDAVSNRVPKQSGLKDVNPDRAWDKEVQDYFESLQERTDVKKFLRTTGQNFEFLRTGGECIVVDDACGARGKFYCLTFSSVGLGKRCPSEPEELGRENLRISSRGAMNYAKKLAEYRGIPISVEQIRGEFERKVSNARRYAQNIAK